MGKKYIIELEEPEMFDERKFYTCTQIPWWALSEDIVENLTPYTAPDLEQVRKEAYEKGLSDAWEAARKIWKYDTTTLKAIFGEGIMRMDWFMKFTASEAIEKLKAYEQEQEEIKVGDEIVAASGKAVVLRVLDVNAYYVYKDATWGVMRCEELVKTGRHFPEIAEVLQKMKESDNG